MEPINKQEVLLDTLKVYGKFRIMVISSKEYGIILPQYLMGTGLVTLDIGYALPIQIKDLLIDGEGFSGIFSFERTPFTVFVPWDALIGVLTPEFNLTWPVRDPKEKSLRLVH